MIFFIVFSIPFFFWHACYFSALSLPHNSLGWIFSICPTDLISLFSTMFYVLGVWSLWLYNWFSWPSAFQLSLANGKHLQKIRGQEKLDIYFLSSLLTGWRRLGTAWIFLALITTSTGLLWLPSPGFIACCSLTPSNLSIAGCRCFIMLVFLNPTHTIAHSSFFNAQSTWLSI